MRIRFVRHILPIGLVLGFAGLLYLLPIARSTVDQIDDSVARTCDSVGALDRESCLVRLIEVLQSDTAELEVKNRAIWVLGQLADERAIPALEALWTGTPCERPCRKDRQICQYELEKALRWCRGEGWMMRKMREFYDSPWQ
jgi:hypothetical protein